MTNQAADKETGKAPATQFAQYPSLTGRRVLITGGATGIGQALVLGFASQGAHVAFFDIQDEAGTALVQQIEAAGHPTPIYRHCDLTEIEAAQTTVRETIAELGGLDIVINNAANDLRHKVEEVTPDLWDRLMDVNLRHQFFITQAALPALQASGAGSVIQMSSISWMVPSTGLPAYTTAKAGIWGLTKTMARELGAQNIRVNCILPGAIVTEKQKRLVLTPEYSAEIMARQSLKRHLVPEDVVRMALFLASDDASAITGQGFIVDGGWV
jgi:NAD(P)-dependent dehydrogenase (short-subunit alcohol dehydrogenase family)